MTPEPRRQYGYRVPMVHPPPFIRVRRSSLAGPPPAPGCLSLFFLQLPKRPDRRLNPTFVQQARRKGDDDAGLFWTLDYLVRLTYMPGGHECGVATTVSSLVSPSLGQPDEWQRSGRSTHLKLLLVVGVVYILLTATPFFS
ncbi:hypothetical protein LY76DRAFT_591296 [Colletotrichum caudatum]|nr:hypothetical protein LY76DRAFT_591296 [Colletotrichum caudatum]